MAVVAQAQKSVRARGRTRGSTRVGRRSIGRGWLIATYIALIIFVLWTIIPFMWMILASFKTNKEIYTDFTFLPKTMYFGHYVSLMGGKFSIWLRNSAEVSIAATALSITLGAIGAYRAQQLQAAAARKIDEVIDRCGDLDPLDIAQTAPLIDLFQSTHDRLYSRLFQS